MSESTADFEAWLEANDPEGHEETYALYMAVDLREDYGIWSVKTKGDKTFIEGHASTLALLGEKARSAFLVKVRGLTGQQELDIESWYGFERNMANPKA